MYWTCHVITRFGQELNISFDGTRKDVDEFIKQKRYRIIRLSPDYRRNIFHLFLPKKLTSASCSIFFEDFNNMLETGMSIPQVISVIRETSKDVTLIMKLDQVQQHIQKGKSLAESLKETGLFSWIVDITIASGEHSGNLAQATKSLGEYFKKAHLIRSKIKQAFIYPAILFVILLLVMFFISIKVIPQLQNLIPKESLDNNSTKGIIAISFMIRSCAVYVITGLLFIGAGIYVWAKRNTDMFERWAYQVPVIGEIHKQFSLALYLLNLSMLLRSGVMLLQAINHLNLHDRSPVAQRFMQARQYMLGGMSFWQSLERDKFFPRIVASTLHRAEEMVRLEEYCFNLSEYFFKRTHNLLEGLIHILQPGLLLMCGGFLICIAFALLLPIYGSLTTIAGGGN